MKTFIGKRVQVVVSRFSQWTVLVPVRPYKVGEIPVRAKAISGSLWARADGKVTVSERGEPHHRHTSVQVDLTSRAYLVRDLAVDPLGANLVVITLTGDVTGPVEPALGLDAVSVSPAG